MLKNRLLDIEGKLARCQLLFDQLLDCLAHFNTIEELSGIFKTYVKGLDYSKVFSAIAFTLCSLHYVKLKLEGKNPRTHPISSQLLRDSYNPYVRAMAALPFRAIS
ncbi:hypothetical protein X943_002396 [Babesia divergens]|uniref:Uncharacterized protein n=1 Tax=Babesia divergens TaxID=32595 RepID=A0AAD9GFJ9_BABDI|nr:hypothetical protein X943_002396 [Babesia divergens]